MAVSEKWGPGQPGPKPEPNLLPKVGPAKTTPGQRPLSTTPPAAKIWQPANITVHMPEKLPTIGKAGQG